MSGWQQGDRVRVLLPDRRRKIGTGFRQFWFTGTVREVDPPGSRGVRVDLDEPVNGVQDCFATHAELERIGDESEPIVTTTMFTEPEKAAWGVAVQRGLSIEAADLRALLAAAAPLIRAEDAVARVANTPVGGREELSEEKQ